MIIFFKKYKKLGKSGFKNTRKFHLQKNIKMKNPDKIYLPIKYKNIIKI